MKDDQGFLRPANIGRQVVSAQASFESHRSSTSSGRSPRSPNLSRQISKLSDQISMIDEEAEDAIEAAAAAALASDAQKSTTTNGEDNTNGYDKVLPTSLRSRPSLRQMSFMRSTAMDQNHRSFGKGGGYYNSLSSRQDSITSGQIPGLKRQVTICEDSMSIPESGRAIFLFV